MYNDGDIIGENIKCSQELRAYFKERIGKGFHFLVPFQEWLHSNPEKTLADACAVYKDIARMARSSRLEIWPQFKYNIFVREQFDKNPNMTLEKAIENWHIYKRENNIK